MADIDIADNHRAARGLFSGKTGGLQLFKLLETPAGKLAGFSFWGVTFPHPQMACACHGPRLTFPPGRRIARAQGQARPLCWCVELLGFRICRSYALINIFVFE